MTASSTSSNQGQQTASDAAKDDVTIVRVEKVDDAATKSGGTPRGEGTPVGVATGGKTANEVNGGEGDADSASQ
jgi:hypothetical protein